MFVTLIKLALGRAEQNNDGDIVFARIEYLIEFCDLDKKREGRL